MRNKLTRAWYLFSSSEGERESKGENKCELPHGRNYDHVLNNIDCCYVLIDCCHEFSKTIEGGKLRKLFFFLNILKKDLSSI